MPVGCLPLDILLESNKTFWPCQPSPPTEYQLYLKLEICEFHLFKIHFLGCISHGVSEEGGSSGKSRRVVWYDPRCLPVHQRVLNLCHRQSSPSSAPRKTLTSAGPTTPLVSRSCALYYWFISVGHINMCACNSGPFLQSLQTNSLTSAAYCYGNCWNFFQPDFLPLRNTRRHSVRSRSARPWSNSLTSGYHLQANGQTKRKIQEVGW